MRPRLIAAELAAAGGLLCALLWVVPGEAARLYALATIVASVLPGLMLTGDVKMLNAGGDLRPGPLGRKAALATLVNLPLVGTVIALESTPLPAYIGALFVLLGVAGATAQAFSSAWYYVQTDRSRILASKAAASAARLGFAGAAIVAGELALALAGLSVGALVEFAANFRALPWNAPVDRPARSGLVSPLGAAYGASRLVSAGIKFGLAQWLGPLVASFLVIEQLVGGANAIFEKYFVRSTRWRRPLRLFKTMYLLAMLALLPWLTTTAFAPHDRTALAWLGLLACASLLPLAEMYAALQRRGESFVAAGSAAVLAIVAIGLALAWFASRLPAAAPSAYVLLPGLTFAFYWWSSLHVRHDTEQQAPR